MGMGKDAHPLLVCGPKQNNLVFQVMVSLNKRFIRGKSRRTSCSAYARAKANSITTNPLLAFLRAVQK
jgi:hypothetical protein